MKFVPYEMKESLSFLFHNKFFQMQERTNSKAFPAFCSGFIDKASGVSSFI